MTSHVEIFDVEHVDDTMWAVRANTLAELNEKPHRLLLLGETCFHKYRLSLNFDPGKTEFMIQYRGKGALGARASLYHNVVDDQSLMQRRGPFWKSSTGRVLEVVCDYKHVGSFVTVIGGQMREAAHRTKVSQSSFCSLRRVHGQLFFGHSTVRLRCHFRTWRSVFYAPCLF